MRRPSRIADVVDAIERRSWRAVKWREGLKSRASRFAAIRVHSAEHWEHGWPASGPIWLVIEWPKGEDRPTKHWLSNLPASTSLKTLVRLAKLRWRIERDYQEMKQEIGLDHFEGRTWRGFHHHAALCAVAHAFLALQRALFPPEVLALDAADGAAPPSGGGLALDRHLPALPQADSSRRATARTLADVIESY